MSKYVFIESRDPFESRDTRFVTETAAALVRRGHEVTVFLVQNAVLALRRDVPDSHLAGLGEAGVSLLADDFSLRERGIDPAELCPGVQASGIETLVDTLAQENTNAIWH